MSKTTSYLLAKIGREVDIQTNKWVHERNWKGDVVHRCRHYFRLGLRLTLTTFYCHCSGYYLGKWWSCLQYIFRMFSDFYPFFINTMFHRKYNQKYSPLCDKIQIHSYLNCVLFAGCGSLIIIFSPWRLKI